MNAAPLQLVYRIGILSWRLDIDILLQQLMENIFLNCWVLRLAARTPNMLAHDVVTSIVAIIIIQLSIGDLCEDNNL